MIRISSLARSYNVTSKSVVAMFNLVAPDLNIKSASSGVEITADNRIFIHTIMIAASKAISV